MKTPNSNKWSKKEDKFLDENYPLMDTMKIARTLKRPIKGVMGRASSRGIRKHPLSLRRRILAEQGEVV